LLRRSSAEFGRRRGELSLAAPAITRSRLDLCSAAAEIRWTAQQFDLKIV
jgi:hypothetical protein